MKQRFHGFLHLIGLIRERLTKPEEAENNIRIAVLQTALITNFIYAACMVVLSLAAPPFAELRHYMAVYALVNVVLYLILRTSRKVFAVGILLILMQNIILFPIFFMEAGGIYSGIILLLLMGMLMTGYVVPGMSCFIFVMIEWGVYAIFFRNICYRKDILEGIVSHRNFFGSMIITFAFVAVQILLLIRVQRKQFMQEQSKMVEWKKTIQKTSNAKEQFLTSMGYEIRTPMNSIIGLTEIMLREDIDKDVKFDLMKVKKASEELLSIIDDVLSYSKLGAGDITVTNREFGMDEIVTNVCETIGNEIGDRNIDINVVMDHEIPKVLYGCDVYIRNIFFYLMFMVLEYLEEGKMVLQISIQERSEDKCIMQVRMAENGKGLSAFDLKMMLGSYHVYDTRQSSNLKGMGMKFKICEELVKLMNGEFEVQSIEDIGMAVIMTFPLGIHDATPMIEVKNPDAKVLVYLETEKEHSMWSTIFDDLGVNVRYVRNKETFDQAILDVKYDCIFLNFAAYEDISDVLEKYECEDCAYVLGKNSSTMGDFGKCRLVKKPLSCLSISRVLNGEWSSEMYKKGETKEIFTARHAKILVVDDNFVNLKVAKGIFKKYEIEIDMANSGKEALQMIQDLHYDMIFLDQMMPEMDGIETLKRIRDSEDVYYATVPIVALTASKGGDIRAQLTRAGFQDFIVKPIKVRYLEETLKKFLPDNLKELREAVAEKKNETQKEEKKPKEIDKTLQTDKGLLNLGYDQEGYYAVLNTYYKEGVDKQKHLPDLLEVGDIQLFTTNVHGIKSASGAIGAMYVSELFRQLEMAGKKADLPFIREHFEEDMQEFDAMLKTVKEYLTEKGKFEELAEELDFSDQEVEEMDMASLADFKKNVTMMNLSACDAFLADFVGHNYGPELNAKVKEMKTGYDNFDFHTVKMVLNELIPE